MAQQRPSDQPYPNKLPELLPQHGPEGSQVIYSDAQRLDHPDYHSQQDLLKHRRHLEHALELAKKVEPKPTNFCVGALIVDADDDQILATGYTGEICNEEHPNTHAEECAIMKLALLPTEPSSQLADKKHCKIIVYTTMEPCYVRLSGNKSCSSRILEMHTSNDEAYVVDKVVCGVFEPPTFVTRNEGRAMLENAGIRMVRVTGYEDKIMEVATSGHQKPNMDA